MARGSPSLHSLKKWIFGCLMHSGGYFSQVLQPKGSVVAKSVMSA